MCNCHQFRLLTIRLSSYGNLWIEMRLRRAQMASRFRLQVLLLRFRRFFWVDQLRALNRCPEMMPRKIELNQLLRTLLNFCSFVLICLFCLLNEAMGQKHLEPFRFYNCQKTEAVEQKDFSYLAFRLWKQALFVSCLWLTVSWNKITSWMRLDN